MHRAAGNLAQAGLTRSKLTAVRILVLIPTRNRSDLAQRAASSALVESSARNVQILISDNSDDAQEQVRLADWSRQRAEHHLSYIRPPEPMEMARHWNWAIDEAVTRYHPTHLTVLTDRMVFRAGAIAELETVARHCPDVALSYLHDRVNDLKRPVILEPRQWSGAVCVLQAARLLWWSADCVFHQCLPRLLNCLVPVAVFERVKRSYGDYCGSLSPDFGFAYRYLATHSEFLYYDKALLTHYAIARSTGTSSQRGVMSKDALNFRKNWSQSRNEFLHTSYPEFMTVGNAILEEYGAAKSRSSSPPFRNINHRRYVNMLAKEIVQIEDPQARKQMLLKLGRRGDRLRTIPIRLAWAFTLRAADLGRAVLRLLVGAARFPPRPKFVTTEEALAYNDRRKGPRLASTRHLAKFNPRPLALPE